MMDTVFISGLKATSVIGCYDWERDIRQTLMIDLELKADFTRAAETDALADALDYAAISKRVIAVCDESRFQLMEALAEHLATLLLAEFSIAGLRMKMTKPGAVEAADGVVVVNARPSRDLCRITPTLRGSARSVLSESRHPNQAPSHPHARRRSP